MRPLLLAFSQVNEVFRRNGRIRLEQSNRDLAFRRIEVRVSAWCLCHRNSSSALCRVGGTGGCSRQRKETGQRSALRLRLCCRRCALWSGCALRSCRARCRRWRRRDRLPFRHNRHLVEKHRNQRLVMTVCLHARDGLHHIHARLIALSEDRVVLVERGVCLLRNEKLAAIGVRPGVRHGQAARDIEVQV